jgi:DNA mismatch endonuclease (patch repair protein)
MSPETRSAVMARIKGKNTGPEMLLAKALALNRLRWESHAPDLPGRPDFVFRRHRVVVFVDGDFWHGWRFSIWRDKLTAKWEQKISGNRRRDVRVHRALRRAGWRVVRIWEHQVERDLDGSVLRVRAAIARPKAGETEKRSRPGQVASDLV